MKNTAVARGGSRPSVKNNHQISSFENSNSPRFVAVLGRQPLISVAELESLFTNVKLVSHDLAEFSLPSDYPKSFLSSLDNIVFPDIARLGGTLKIGIKVTEPIVSYLKTQLSEQTSKVTLGVSDFFRKSNPYLAQKEALKLKRILVKSGHSVRVVPNKTAILSSATSLHNHLFASNKIEILKFSTQYYRVLACQDIESYTKRDQARPARDAKVGMLPPKLAQILINLCNSPSNYLQSDSRVLDPFCGTGVVLQEANLMNYQAYGTDLEQRMISYSERNLKWLDKGEFFVEQGDATTHQWGLPIDGIACEVFLGQPMSQPPVDIKLKQEKQKCKEIIIGFLRNLSTQIKNGTPVTIAVPAWLRPNGAYSRLDLLDEISNLGYNVVSFKNLGQKDLLYHRDKQIVAREIIVLRKK